MNAIKKWAERRHMTPWAEWIKYGSTRAEYNLIQNAMNSNQISESVRREVVDRLNIECDSILENLDITNDVQARINTGKLDYCRKHNSEFITFYDELNSYITRIQQKIYYVKQKNERMKIEKLEDYSIK